MPLDYYYYYFQFFALHLFVAAIQLLQPNSIYQFSTTAKPFFKLLKKNAIVKWDAECKQAFDKIKEYLVCPPVLVPPISGVSLILYLMIHYELLGAVLVQRRPNDGKEQAIYCLSKKFTTSKVNYPAVEKTCVALI